MVRLMQLLPATCTLTCLPLPSVAGEIFTHWLIFQYPASWSSQPGPLVEGRGLPDSLLLCIEDIPDESIFDEKTASC
jgi:hypothetical protein